MAYRQTDYPMDLPPAACPTTVQQRGHTWHHAGFHSVRPAITELASEWFCTVIRRPATMIHIVQGLRTGTAILVTDGSYKDGLGTAAFALRAAETEPDGIDAVSMTPGDKSAMDPTGRSWQAYMDASA